MLTDRSKLPIMKQPRTSWTLTRIQYRALHRNIRALLQRKTRPRRYWNRRRYGTGRCRGHIRARGGGGGGGGRGGRGWSKSKSRKELN